MDTGDRRQLQRNSATDWPARLHGTAELAIGLSLLRFPRNSGRTPEIWANALSCMQDDASGEDRVRLHAYLLSAAFQKNETASWTLYAPCCRSCDLLSCGVLCLMTFIKC